MAELINMRAARKRQRRREEEVRADANRVAYGQPKHARKLGEAQREKATRDLDAHRIDTGDGQ